MSQIHLLTRQSQSGQSQEQQAQSEEEVTDIAVLLHIDEDDTQEESDVGHDTDIERRTQGDDPCRERGTDIGTHNHGDSLRQGEQSGINKRNSHHGCSR